MSHCGLDPQSPYKHMTFSANNLSDWLTHLEVAHVKPIDLGLDRVLEVKRRLIANGLLTLN